MAWVLTLVPFYWMLAISIPIGGAAGGLSYWLDTHKRGDGTQDIIFAFNTTSLKARDLQHLRGLRMDVDGTAANFSVPGRFQSTGVVTGVEDPAVDGLMTGGLSFSVPGIDDKVEGKWVAVDMSKKGEKPELEEFFTKYHGWLKDMPALPTTLDVSVAE